MSQPQHAWLAIHCMHTYVHTYAGLSLTVCALAVFVFVLFHSGYEGDSIKLAENDVLSLNTSAGAKQQQKQVLKLTNLLSAIEALAQQAVKRSAADPAGLIKASEWNSPEANTAPSAPVYVSDWLSNVLHHDHDSVDLSKQGLTGCAASKPPAL